MAQRIISTTAMVYKRLLIFFSVKLILENMIDAIGYLSVSIRDSISSFDLPSLI